MINFEHTLDGLKPDRRDILRLGMAAALMPAFAGDARAAASTNNNQDSPPPANKLETHVKLIGTTEKSRIYVLLEGSLWGVAPGRSPEAICGFRGLARSDWKPAANNGFSQRSFDIGFFSDLETGEPLKKLVNPMTGETVAPFHYKYGGDEIVHSQKSVNKASDSSWGRSGNNIYFTERRGGTFPPPFPAEKWPRESAGDTYYFGSETSYIVPAGQLSDVALTKFDYSLFWSSFLSWEPWLLMQGAPGFVMWRGIGSKLVTHDQIPERLQEYIAKTQPNYFGAKPPWEGRESSYRRYKETRSPAV